MRTRPKRKNIIRTLARKGFALPSQRHANFHTQHKPLNDSRNWFSQGMHSQTLSSHGNRTTGCSLDLSAWMTPAQHFCCRIHSIYMNKPWIAPCAIYSNNASRFVLKRCGKLRHDEPRPCKIHDLNTRTLNSHANRTTGYLYLLYLRGTEPNLNILSNCYCRSGFQTSTLTVTMKKMNHCV